MEIDELDGLPQCMKEDLEGRRYTRKVGDRIEYDSDNQFPGVELYDKLIYDDIYGVVIYEDDCHAIAEIFGNAKHMDPNIHANVKLLSYEEVVGIIGHDFEHESDFFTDLYASEDTFYDGEQYMAYTRIWEAELEYVAQAGEQSVTMIVPAKVYGQPKWNAIPMEQDELERLGLEGEKNCYRVLIPLTKQYSKGDAPMGSDSSCSVIVYSRNNIAVLATYNDFEGGREVSYEELKGLPGFDYETYTSGERYFIIDMVTGESNEEYHYIPMKTKDGEEFYGIIEGYHFVGNKPVARYMSVSLELPGKLDFPITKPEVGDDFDYDSWLADFNNDVERMNAEKTANDERLSRILKSLEDKRIHPCYDWTNGNKDLFRFDLEEGDNIEFYRG